MPQLCQDDEAFRARIEKLLAQLAALKDFFAKMPWYVDGF